MRGGQYTPIGLNSRTGDGGVEQAAQPMRLGLERGLRLGGERAALRRVRLEGIEHGGAGLELIMEVRRERMSGVAGERDGLSARDLLAGAQRRGHVGEVQEDGG